MKSFSTFIWILPLSVCFFLIPLPSLAKAIELPNSLLVQLSFSSANESFSKNFSDQSAFPSSSIALLYSTRFSFHKEIKNSNSFLFNKTPPSSLNGEGQKTNWLETALENMEWTWLSLGITAFISSTAIITAVDARSMEKSLAQKLAASQYYPQPGNEILDLKNRTEKRAAMANILWGASACGLLASSLIFYFEAGSHLGSGGSIFLSWSLP